MKEMTKETAIANLKADIKYWEDTTVSTEHLSMAIKALQQEPCEDCISREAVLEIYDEWFATCNIADKKESPKSKIKALPSVTPKLKAGHWIKEKSMHGWDGNSYQCSECGRSIHIDPEVEDLSDYPYCHCGSKMINPQEGEISE